MTPENIFHFRISGADKHSVKSKTGDDTVVST